MEEELELSYLDDHDIVDDVVGVDFNIAANLYRQLQMRTAIVVITMLCIVAHVLNILIIYSNNKIIVKEFVLDKDHHRK